MIRLQASFALAVALIALGTAQASAELVVIDPDTQLVDTSINTAWAPGATLGTVPCPIEPNKTILSAVYSKSSLLPGMSRVFGYRLLEDGSVTYDAWTDDFGYLEVVFAEPVSYARVEVAGTAEGDPEEYAELLGFSGAAAWDDETGWNSTAASRITWDRTEQFTNELVIDLPSAQIRRVLIAGGHLLNGGEGGWVAGQSIAINAIQYSVDPYDPPPVPEPASLVGLLIGAVALVGTRLRRR
jgi:hypothetical protein